MRYFLFDIGHVLVNFDTQDFLQEVAKSTGRAVEPLTARDLEKVDEVEKGLISDAEYVGYLNMAKGLSWTVDDLTDVWARMFSINEVGRNLFERATQAGIPVYTLSNIARHHIDAIESNWNDFFSAASGLFLSYQIGFRKPDASIYRHTLEQLGVAGEQCFFIDDRPENIEAARTAGIHAHQFIPENHAMIRDEVSAFFGLQA